MLRLFVVPSAVFVCAGFALAQTPTLSLVPIVDDVRRECVGGPNDGQLCTSAADCEVLPDCQRVCVAGPFAGEPCTRSTSDCQASVCQQRCFCNSVITVEPGAVIETEVFSRDWSAYGQRLRAWEARIQFERDPDVVLPLGWDRPFHNIPCSWGDCPPEYPICDAGLGRCVGPDHDPEQGVFVDPTRSDYVFFGLAELGPIFDFSLPDRFRAASTLWDTSDAVVFAEPKYCSSLILEVLPDASGTVTVSFGSTSYLASTTVFPIEPLDTEGLTIEIGTGEEPPDLVPAVSQWGVLVMALLLLAGAKVYFSRRRCNAT